MRPLKLIISAFGSYAGETQIDMAALGKTGIYLITGDTGAGKTTIFDAISFALYGEPSGDERSAAMLRCKSAKPETDTFVELEFSYGGKGYTVRRSPAYKRPKKRGEGFTDKPPEATLWLPGGDVITSISEVGRAINEIMGIDRAQFNQISMIAQGDFKKLLTSTTAERREIYRKIFQTMPFNSLQERLRSAVSVLEGELREKNARMSLHISSLDCRSQSEQSERMELLRLGNLPSAELMPLVEELIESDTLTLQNEEQNRSAFDAEAAALERLLGRAEQDQRARLELSSAKSEREIASEKLKAAQADYAEKRANESRLESLSLAIAEEEAALPQYEKLEQAARAFKIMQEQGEKAESERELLQKKSDSAERQSLALREELASLSQSGEELARLEFEAQALRARDKSLRYAAAQSHELREKRLEKQRARERYLSLRETSQSTAASAAALEDSFLNAQAGILALSLREGAPCPVCGAHNHPQPAQCPENAPDEAAVKSAKLSAEKAQAACAAASENCAKLGGDIASSSASLQKSCETLGIFGDDLNTALQSALSESSRQIKNAEKAIEEKSAQTKRLAALQAQDQSLAQSLQALQKKLAELQSAIAAQNASLAAAQKTREELSSSLKFESRARALAHIMALKQERAQLQGDIETARLNLQNQQSACTALDARIGALSLQLEGSEPLDAEPLKLRRAELRALLELSNATAISASARLKANKGARAAIAATKKELDELEARLQWLSSLSATASGKLKGAQSVMLETYVQMAYFERVLKRANRRLLVMSNGRYELSRTSEGRQSNSQSGLDMNVIDHLSSGTRSIKSLSGGESFMASLALALGLSDEIQSSAGGIRLETMFIDEGFGTLDEETLSQAMRVLTDLAQTSLLIGVISHVPALKSRIEKQIVVSRGNDGCSSVSLIT